MRIKKCATKALQPLIKVVLVKEGYIMLHIYIGVEKVIGWMNLHVTRGKSSKL